MPKVSVVVPIYGVEKYLRQCVDSILSQTLKDIEVILVDDGSPDGCPAIVDEYAKRDPRVVAIHQPNGGVSFSRNKALSIAKGEYISFIDPDDLFYSGSVLEDLYKTAVNNNCLVAGGKVLLFNDGEDPYTSGWSIPLFTNFPHYGVVDYRDFQSLNNFGCYIYNREFLQREKFFFPELAQFEDPVFFVKVMVAAGKFFALDKVVYLYRRGVHYENHIGESYEKLNDRATGQLMVLKMAEENRFGKLAEIVVDYFLTTVKCQKHSRYTIAKSCIKEFADIVLSSMLIKTAQKRRLRRKLGFGVAGKIDLAIRAIRNFMKKIFKHED